MSLYVIRFVNNKYLQIQTEQVVFIQIQNIQLLFRQFISSQQTLFYNWSES